MLAGVFHIPTLNFDCHADHLILVDTASGGAQHPAAGAEVAERGGGQRYSAGHQRPHGAQREALPSPDGRGGRGLTGQKVRAQRVRGAQPAGLAGGGGHVYEAPELTARMPGMGGVADVRRCYKYLTKIAIIGGVKAS